MDPDETRIDWSQSSGLQPYLLQYILCSTQKTLAPTSAEVEIHLNHLLESKVLELAEQQINHPAIINQPKNILSGTCFTNQALKTKIKCTTKV